VILQMYLYFRNQTHTKHLNEAPVYQHIYKYP